MDLYEAHRCLDCEVLLPESEDQLCEDCQSDFIGWLQARDQEREQSGAYAPDHTPGSDGDRPSP